MNAPQPTRRGFLGMVLGAAASAALPASAPKAVPTWNMSSGDWDVDCSDNTYDIGASGARRDRNLYSGLGASTDSACHWTRVTVLP